MMYNVIVDVRVVNWNRNCCTY